MREAVILALSPHRTFFLGASPHLAWNRVDFACTVPPKKDSKQTTDLDVVCSFTALPRVSCRRQSALVHAADLRAKTLFSHSYSPLHPLSGLIRFRWLGSKLESCAGQAPFVGRGRSGVGSCIRCSLHIVSAAISAGHCLQARFQAQHRNTQLVECWLMASASWLCSGKKGSSASRRAYTETETDFYGTQLNLAWHSKMPNLGTGSSALSLPSTADRRFDG